MAPPIKFNSEKKNLGGEIEFKTFFIRKFRRETSQVQYNHNNNNVQGTKRALKVVYWLEKRQ